MIDARIQSRRAVEALRAGVPNRDAVTALGSAQPEIEGLFREQLAQSRETPLGGEAAPGLEIAGDFGAGKSHLLEYFQHVALEEHFVCSKVAVSKEMPLYDLTRVFRAAISSANIGQRDAGLSEIFLKMNRRKDSQAYADFRLWAESPSRSGLDPRFPATLWLSEYDNDEEFRERLIGFWSGDPLTKGDLTKRLRENRQLASYDLGKAPLPQELASQRFRFATAMMRAAGYAGWVLLIDEVEVIASYRRPQRARSYVEIARWANRLVAEPSPGPAAVLAIAADFALKILDEKGDRDAVPARLQAHGGAELASQAERGMRVIERECKTLRTPDQAVLDETYARVREIHGAAYGWNPPDAGWPPERLGSNPMRSYVRYWINDWDLKRLYPEETSRLEVTPFSQEYSEDADLETPAEDGSVDNNETSRLEVTPLAQSYPEDTDLETPPNEEPLHENRDNG